MKRIAGIAILLIAIMSIAGIIEPTFASPYNLKNIFRWTGLFGLLSLGEAFVIMTGGIDLSVGSIVGLLGAFTAHFLKVRGMSIPLALFLSPGIPGSDGEILHDCQGSENPPSLGNMGHSQARQFISRDVGQLPGLEENPSLADG